MKQGFLVIIWLANVVSKDVHDVVQSSSGIERALEWNSKLTRGLNAAWRAQVSGFFFGERVSKAIGYWVYTLLLHRSYRLEEVDMKDVRGVVASIAL